MSALKTLVPLSGNLANATQSIGRFTAPANQKVWVWVRIFFKDTGTPVFLPVELRRATSGGTYAAATTQIKKNSADDETPQGSVQAVSAQPTNDGLVCDSADIRSDRDKSFTPILVSGGGTLDVFVISPSVIAYKLVFELEQ